MTPTRERTGQVYVGPLMPCVSLHGVVLAECAFLFGDRVDEAHRLATRLRVGTAYWHDMRWPHYEVTKRERLAALWLGAQILTASGVTSWLARHGYLRRDAREEHPCGV